MWALGGEPGVCFGTAEAGYWGRYHFDPRVLLTPDGGTKISTGHSQVNRDTGALGQVSMRTQK